MVSFMCDRGAEMSITSSRSLFAQLSPEIKWWTLLVEHSDEVVYDWDSGP